MDKISTGELELKNWNRISELSDYQRGMLLSYLCGYKKDDRDFLEAVEHWLNYHLPSISDVISDTTAVRP